MARPATTDTPTTGALGPSNAAPSTSSRDHATSAGGIIVPWTTMMPLSILLFCMGFATGIVRQRHWWLETAIGLAVGGALIAYLSIQAARAASKAQP